MDIKNLHLIINPKNLDGFDSMLGDVENLLQWSDIKYKISVSTKTHPISNIVEEDIESDVDTILVYGGDGSVMEVVQTLLKYPGNYHPQLQLGVLPGGTANIISKEVGWGTMPPRDIIAKILEGKFTTNKIDLAQVNGEIFFLRINIGVTADMITETSESEKSSYGIFAYSLEALKKFLDSNTDEIKFKMKIDGEDIEVEGVSLMVNNAGNIGIEGVSMFNDISILDGLLDVVLIEDANAINLIKISLERALGKDDLSNIRRWQAKNITIEMPEEKTIIQDDKEVNVKKLEISVLPDKLNLIFPEND